MNADLARCVALVAHGNAFLSGLIRPPDLHRQNSAFQFVRSIEFRTPGRRSIHRVDLWLSALAKRGATRLVVRSDDLAAEGADSQEVWVPSTVLISEHFEGRQDRQIQRLAETGVWNHEEQSALSSILARSARPWRLYFNHEARSSRTRRRAGIEQARTSLTDALTEARDFSRQHRLGYVGTFNQSLMLLNAPRSSAGDQSDLLPPVGYSRDARLLFAAARNAWVFGGMGAFGDVAFEDEDVASSFWSLYRELSAAVVDALLAATNDFDRSQKGRNAV